MAKDSASTVVLLSRRLHFQEELAAILSGCEIPLLRASSDSDIPIGTHAPGLIIYDHTGYGDETLHVLKQLRDRKDLASTVILMVVEYFSNNTLPNDFEYLDVCPMVPELIRARVHAILERHDLAEELFESNRRHGILEDRLENEIRYHKETERILSENEQTLRRIFHSIEATGEAILITEKSGVVYYVNPAFCLLSGYTESDVFGCEADPFFAFVHPTLDLKKMKETAMKNGSWRGDVTLKRQDGSLYDAYLDLTSVKGISGEFEGLIFIQRDISTIKKMMKELERLARMDSLTALFNRRYFMERMADELERAKRYKHPISLMMLDLDYFKQINDSYGHGVGDRVLEVTGLIINNQMRSMDLGGRYGGEEFCIALPETNEEGAIIFAERLRARINDEDFCHDGLGPFSVTCSIGLAQLDKNPSGFHEISHHFRCVDKALYRAKEKGRNCVEVAPDGS